MADDKNNSTNSIEKETEKKLLDDDMNDDDGEKHDDFEDGDKSKDSQTNTLIKLKGIPRLDGPVKYNNYLYKLFVDELKISPPDYRFPRVRDKWIYMDVHTFENKKKVLETIGDKYNYDGRELTVKPIGLKERPKTEPEEKRVLDEESALDIMLKFRKMTYPQQLKTKSDEADEMIQGIVNTLKASNTKFGKSLDRFPKLSDMIPMLPIDGYANDNTFNVELDPETNKVKVGLRVVDKSLPYIVPIEKCRQVPRPVIEAVQDFVDHLEEYGLKPYNPETTEGDVVGIFCQMNTACEIIMSILIPSEIIISKDFTPITVPQVEENDKAKEDGKEDGGQYEEEGDEVKQSGDKMDVDVTKDTSKTETEENGEEVKLNDVKKGDADGTGGGDTKKTADNAEDRAMQELEDEVAEARLLQEEDDYEMNTTTKNSEMKEIKAAIIKYFNERGKNLGIVAFYSNLTFYSKSIMWYDRAPYCNYVVGKVTLKESMNGVQFDVSPYRPWSPRTAAHLQILSLIERLAHFDSGTVVGIYSEMRFLEVYFAKKCKAVVCLHPWNAKRANISSKWAIKHGFRNIEFVSSKQGYLQILEKTSLSRNAPKVAVVWTGTRPSVIKKFYEMGCRQIILVSTTHKAKFQDIARHVEFVGSHMAVTKIYGVDTQPHGHTYTLVALVEELAGGGKRRHSDGPLGVGAKRRSLQPLMDQHGSSSSRRPWDSGPPSGQSQGDQWSTALSQMTGFMQNQLIFNEMMKQGIQQMFPNKSDDQRGSNSWADCQDYDMSNMRRQRGGDSRYGGGYGGQRGIGGGGAGGGGGGGGNRNSRDSGNYNKRRRSNMRNNRGGGQGDDSRAADNIPSLFDSLWTPDMCQPDDNMDDRRGGYGNTNLDSYSTSSGNWPSNYDY